MSAIVSMVSAEAACMLTDGAAYRDGMLESVVCKAFRPRSAPLAVSARGNWDMGKTIAGTICAAADEIGAEATMDTLQDFADVLHDRYGVLDGYNLVQVLVCAYVPGIGGVHRSFATRPRHRNGGLNGSVLEPAYSIFTPPICFVVGTRLRDADLVENGLNGRPGEAMPAYARRVGADLMEIMRRRPGPDVVTGEESYIIGGRCDLTTIDARGARTETLRTWPDRIGEKIDPFRTASPIAGMNRKQRRAMRR